MHGTLLRGQVSGARAGNPGEGVPLIVLALVDAIECGESGG